MRLRDYLAPGSGVVELRAHDLRGAISELVQHAREVAELPDAPSVEQALLTREAAHTTAMGQGIAIPHATVAGLEQPLLLIARSLEGVAFDPAGAERVRLFFFVLSPPAAATLHVKLLARIARFARHHGFSHSLLQARTGDELLELLLATDSEHV